MVSIRTGEIQREAESRDSGIDEFLYHECESNGRQYRMQSTLGNRSRSFGADG